MKKSDINPMPEYFDRYINTVADVELSEAFDQSIEQIEKLDVQLLDSIGDKTYAPDKWTVKTLIQHIIDFERILSYRALLFAREDTNLRQGVDEQMLAVTAKAEARSLEDLIAELKAVRLATKTLFASFDDEMLMRKGVNWKYETSVLAVGFMIIGHQIHHFKIIADKYFPLAEKGLANQTAN
jgi:hypothetical protein